MEFKIRTIRLVNNIALLRRRARMKKAERRDVLREIEMVFHKDTANNQNYKIYTNPLNSEFQLMADLYPGLPAQEASAKMEIQDKFVRIWPSLLLRARSSRILRALICNRLNFRDAPTLGHRKLRQKNSK